MSTTNTSGGNGGNKRFLFMIVSPNDVPIFSAHFGALSHQTEKEKDEQEHLFQFVLHAALDAVDVKMWKVKDMNLKDVDAFHEWTVSAYITPSKTRFLLLHDGPYEDAMKSFFQDIHELYVKAILNPFHGRDKQLEDPKFSELVHTSAKKLGVR
eukprot:m.67076 g.67076  ORF g.67076 m.67076 type:complete len:154 (+) comp11566_c0_seq1:63-524(+)